MIIKSIIIQSRYNDAFHRKSNIFYNMIKENFNKIELYKFITGKPLALSSLLKLHYSEISLEYIILDIEELYVVKETPTHTEFP